MILNDVGKYMLSEPLYEGIRVILNFTDEQYTPEYIQGISGAAFRIGGICPCAPTCTYAIEPIDFVKMLGHRAEHMEIGKEASERENILKKIKKEIDGGRPMLVWHAFTSYEWDVVCGYDEKEKLLYGRGSYAGLNEYAAADEKRFLNCDICPGVIFIGPKVSSFDAKKAEINSLKEAVAHAFSEKNADKVDGGEWVFLEGIKAYQRWYEDYRSPEKKRTAGDSYCFSVYKTTHRAAAGYLREIAPKYKNAEKYLIKAADHFQKEADALQKGDDLLSWDSPEGPDRENNIKTTEILKEACGQYILGINNIEKALINL
ncbi:MAG: hypothetical protein JXB33_10820 [Clostridia bacterium]|nr:hypothetical protein [Clostridia bacterium]